MKPKHLPRLWCAMQGLLPLGLKPMTSAAPEVVARLMPAVKAARPPLTRKRRRRTS